MECCYKLTTPGNSAVALQSLLLFVSCRILDSLSLRSLHQSSELRPKLERSAAGSVFTGMKKDAAKHMTQENKNEPSCLNKSSAGCTLTEPLVICSPCPCITSGVIFGVSRQTLRQACFACAWSAEKKEWAHLARRCEVILFVLDLVWHAHSMSAARDLAALKCGWFHSTPKVPNISLLS